MMEWNLNNRSQPSPIRPEKASPAVKFEFEEQIAINQSPQIVSDPSLDGYAVHKLGKGYLLYEFILKITCY